MVVLVVGDLDHGFLQHRARHVHDQIDAPMFLDDMLEQTIRVVGFCGVRVHGLRRHSQRLQPLDRIRRRLLVMGIAHDHRRSQARQLFGDSETHVLCSPDYQRHLVVQLSLVAALLGSLGHVISS